MKNMKLNIIYKATGVFAVSSLLLVSCAKKSLNDINLDPNNPTEVPTTTIIVAAEKLLMDNLRNENISLK